MTQRKVPNLTDHTHTNSSPKNDGFQSIEDKVLLDALGSQKPAYDAIISATKEPTGFTNNANITVTYDSTTRKITLNGDFIAYEKGVLVRELTDGWVSPAHADVQGTYYLYYCDGELHFDTAPWTFACLMIAFIQYNSHKLAIREVHGFMQNMVHEELHKVIGSIKTSGGDFTGFVLSSTVATERRPDVSNTVVTDEDLPSTVLALTTKSYTQRYLVGATGVRTFNLSQTEIIAVSGSQPYWNQFTGGAWQQTLFSNNSYGAIFVVALPTTNDAGSQAFRYMFVQPQLNSSSLAEIQALSPSSLVHGDSSMLVSEFVFIGKIIIRYTGGNWSIVQVDKLEGSRVSNVAINAGGLSVVSHDTTLTGDGTPISPLSVVQDKLPLAGGTMSGTIVSTPIGIVEGKYLGVTRGFLASDANGMGFLDNAADWAVRVPFGTKNWEVIGKTRIAEGLTYSDANNSTIFNRYIVQKGGTALGTGYWVKYYDGTMIMWFTVAITVACQTANSAAGGYTQASADTLNFPQNFVDSNYSAVIGGGAGNIGGTINSKAAGSLTYFLRTIASSASASRTFEIQLMGRWY